MMIAGYKFKFVKLKAALFSFGIIGNELKYSDPEKTILDFIYVWRYNGISKEKISADLGEWSINLSRPTLTNYAKNYPKTVQEIVREML